MRRFGREAVQTRPTTITAYAIAEATLKSFEKRFSNHSTRKTLSKMKKANLERSSIAKVTVNSNIQSLDNYDEADEHEQRQLSWAISERNSTAKPMPVASSTSSPSSSSAVIPHTIDQPTSAESNGFLH